MGDEHLLVVLSDIHGNYPALKAVAEDVQQLHHQVGTHVRLFCVSLGDVVDYGPNPNECVTWVETHADVKVLGNHDWEVVQPLEKEPLSINRHIWPLTLWTRLVLRPKNKTRIEAWKTPADWKEMYCFFHSSLIEPDGYIRTEEEARGNFRRLFEMAPANGQPLVGFFGHTHNQHLFVYRRGRVERFWVAGNAREVEVLRKRGMPLLEVNRWSSPPAGITALLFNPGSVGLPREDLVHVRDGLPPDRRAGYLALSCIDGHMKFQFRRVSYRVEDTIRQLEAIQWPGGLTSDAQHNDLLAHTWIREIVEHHGRNALGEATGQVIAQLQTTRRFQ